MSLHACIRGLWLRLAGSDLLASKEEMEVKKEGCVRLHITCSEIKSLLSVRGEFATFSFRFDALCRSP